MPDGKKAVNNLDDGKPFLRLEPEKRMCPIFDPVTIAKFPVAPPMMAVAAAMPDRRARNTFFRQNAMARVMAMGMIDQIP